LERARDPRTQRDGFVESAVEQTFAWPLRLRATQADDLWLREMALRIEAQ
jgi:hypothetical protein